MIGGSCGVFGVQGVGLDSLRSVIDSGRDEKRALERLIFSICGDIGQMV